MIVDSTVIVGEKYYFFQKKISPGASVTSHMAVYGIKTGKSTVFLKLVHSVQH